MNRIESTLQDLIEYGHAPTRAAQKSASVARRLSDELASRGVDVDRLPAEDAEALAVYVKQVMEATAAQITSSDTTHPRAATNLRVIDTTRKTLDDDDRRKSEDGALSRLGRALKGKHKMRPMFADERNRAELAHKEAWDSLRNIVAQEAAATVTDYAQGMSPAEVDKLAARMRAPRPSLPANAELAQGVKAADLAPDLRLI